MGITDWQRRLLEALTNLETGQVETNRRLASFEEGQRRLEAGQIEGNMRLANIDGRLVTVEEGQRRLEAGQIEGNMRLANIDGRLVTVEERLVGVESAVTTLGRRLDRTLTTIVGEPVRELRERVDRLERAVFRPENAE